MSYSFDAYSRVNYLGDVRAWRDRSDRIIIYPEDDDYPFLLDGKPKGMYQVAGEREDFNMCFSNYGLWWDVMLKALDKLSLADSEIAWRDAGEDRIFNAMAYLTCYGRILGPVTSGKLADDFKNHRAVIEAFIGSDEEIRQIIEDKITDDRQNRSHKSVQTMEEAIQEERQDLINYYDQFTALFELARQDGFMKMW